MARKALGRGLRALIPEPEAAPQPAAETGDPGSGDQYSGGHLRELQGEERDPFPTVEGVRSLLLDLIVPSDRQPRTEWDPVAMEQLAHSIAEKGLLEPIIVRPMGARFEIVAGERRWRACRILGWEAIPALIRSYEDQESLEAALIENIQREDLSPVEEARAYEMLIDVYGLSHEETARRVGKDRSTISNLIRVLRLPAAVLRDVSRGTLTVGHARVLLGLPDDQRVAAAERITQEKWTVRETEAWVKSVLEGRSESRPRPARRGRPKPPEIRRIEDDLCRHFGSQAKIRMNRRGGRIELHFHDDEELSRLLEIIGVVVA
ncbi:MAG: ParB/RepB/Spo0J family partition protein [Candidatus Eisenbacteria sp.]|nr:ParB/RepB/Spo0J family partition protein [Candidatus Eisenbacteria bacterium]